MTILVYDPLYLRHEARSHPERPQRLTSIIDHLKKCALWDLLTPVSARDATDEELRLVHSPDHLGRLRSVRPPAWLDPDTYMNEYSLAAAIRAAGGVLAACEAVLAGRDTTALCLVRPPGHHATPDEAMGFCLFNNVAIAARWLRRRVMIVDWDVHHGNGTQDIFCKDPSVLYLSTHRWPFYPGTGREDERGVGNIVNLPIEAGTSPGRILERFESAVREAAGKFKPEFVLISCGFDAYAHDPIGGLGMQPDDYAKMTRVLREAAPVPVVSALEGGYSLEGLGPCTEMHLRELLYR
jgi:acetoin utilization deacetylase AcuC-like enzyme